MPNMTTPTTPTTPTTRPPVPSAHLPESSTMQIPAEVLDAVHHALAVPLDQVVDELCQMIADAARTVDMPGSSTPTSTKQVPK